MLVRLIYCNSIKVRFDADEVNIRKQIRMKYDASDVKIVKQNKEEI